MTNGVGEQQVKKPGRRDQKQAGLQAEPEAGMAANAMAVMSHQIRLTTPVNIVRHAGTQHEQRWPALVGGDLGYQAFLPADGAFRVNDEIHNETLDEPRIIVGYDAVVVSIGLSHWRAAILPCSEWKRRRDEQKVLALKSRNGRAFPRPMFHPTKPPVTVYSQTQQSELGMEWSEEYIYQPYPKCKYHWVQKERVVKSLEEDLTLRDGWGALSDFAPYRKIPRVRSLAHDPTKWVDEWAVVGLSAGFKNKIKAQLLKGDATFWQSPDSDSADRTSMKLAFDGIAQVLFEAHILTEQLLENEIPALVWDSSIAGGWYRFASEFPESIFPEPLGHYWIWRDDRSDWNALFRSEQAKWQAELLETDSVAERQAVSSAVQELSGVKDREVVRRNPRYEAIDQALRKSAEARPTGQKEVFESLEGRVTIPNAEPFKSARGWMAGFRQDTAAARAWLSKRWAELNLPPLPRGPKNTKK